jgi:hypothetical protein
MTNVDSILNYTRTEEEDYYAILGCDETSTVSIKGEILCSVNIFFLFTFHIVGVSVRPLHWFVTISALQKFQHEIVLHL